MSYESPVDEIRKELSKKYISIAWLEERASEFESMNTYANNFAAGFLRALIRDWREENG